MIIWRRDESRVRHEWLSERWPEEEDGGEGAGAEQGRALGGEGRVNKTQKQLADTLRRLLRPTEVLSYETVVKVINSFLILL